MKPLAPGSTIGILGSGQLGRMLALAARPLGYRVHVYAPDTEGAPASQVADFATTADYLDNDALDAFAAACDVITIEFENIPAAALAAAAEAVPVRPGITSLHTTQNRGREKRFLAEAGVPHARFAPVDDASALDAALGVIGIFVPLMPTTVFLLLAAAIVALFAVGQPRQTLVGAAIVLAGVPVSWIALPRHR